MDSPANPLAMAPLYKRNSEGDNMTKEVDTAKELEDLNKKFEGLSKETEVLKADADKLKKENERLRKGLLDEGYVIKADSIEKKAPVEYIEYEGEKINKADVPAPILKKLEEADAKEAEAALEKKADEKLPNFEKDVAKKLVALIEKSAEDDMDMLFAALEAADKAFADKMAEFGKADTDGDMGDAQAKLDKLVKSYQTENDVTYARAYATIVKTTEGKALVKELYKKG